MNNNKEILVYGATEVAPFFRLTNDKAAEIIQHTVNVVSGWRQLAMKYKLSRDEQDKISSAFLQ